MMCLLQISLHSAVALMTKEDVDADADADEGEITSSYSYMVIVHLISHVCYHN